VTLSDARAAFRERLVAAGLGHHAASLEALIRPSIRLSSQLVFESEIEVGQSKLGGRPDVPPAFEWPSYEGLPQSFIAQVNLDEVHACDREHVLPAGGLLSFFYDSQQRVWGFDPAEDGAWLVHYTADSATVERRDLPADLPDEGRYRALRFHPELELTYAPWEFSEVAAVLLTREERVTYAELIDAEYGPIHRLLGHPEPVQGDMQLEAQLVSHGLYCGDSRGYDDRRAAELEPGAVEWRLLLQIDSEDDAGMMWGDVGRIYYWMHREDLASERWEKARLILQCS
jgi:uncharacterized protein YwqG